MITEKLNPAAARTANGARDFVKLAADNPESTPAIARLQAAHVARRLHIQPALAALIAPIVYGEVAT